MRAHTEAQAQACRDRHALLDAHARTCTDTQTLAEAARTYDTRTLLVAGLRTLACDTAALNDCRRNKLLEAPSHTRAR